MDQFPLRAKLYVALTAAFGLASVVWQSYLWESGGTFRFFCYWAIAVLASRLKVSLPGVTGTMSVVFLFILIGIAELGLPQTLVIGCSATMIQCIWHTKARPRPVQVLFNGTSMAIAIVLSGLVYRWLQHFPTPPALRWY